MLRGVCIIVRLLILFVYVEMEKCKVNLLGLKRIADCESGMALIFLNEKKENSIVSFGGANYWYSDFNCLDDKFKQAIDSSKV